jgi:glycosyltransferase involved in cell wall biosynthesis
MGSDCASSLQTDYGVDAQRCFVTLAPQDTEQWTPAPAEDRHALALLFVGNDFVRKGGDFLLNLYSDRLRDTCTLTIASNDARVGDRQLPQGVTWIQGRSRDQLLSIYRQHDLLVLPTRQDFMPQVLAEALTTGLPCIATDVGAICDLVRDGETGFLMHWDATAGEWADRILQLATAGDDLRRMSISARRFAEEFLSVERFEALMSGVVERLGAMR